MNVQSRGYVDPARWDDGIPAAFVNYNLTGEQTRQSETQSRSSYLNLRNGANLGPWRLRNISSMQYDQHYRWHSQSTWLQRDVKSVKSLLRIGDTFTSGEVFDSVQFRGVQLMSDDEMLPDSQRGFAPVIRGMAHSNAKVTVSQHGYVIYETFVSPGAFAINDLYPTAQSGDLEVQVKESDGSVRSFTQPYSTVPFMLREGRTNLALAQGVIMRVSVRSDRRSLCRERCFMVCLRSSPSMAAPAGAGLSGLGAGRWAWFWRAGVVGSDVTWANTATLLTDTRGAFIARAVSKGFCRTGTSFSLASYRYSSGGYYDFSEANALQSPGERWTTSVSAKRSLSRSPLAAPVAWRFPLIRKRTGTATAMMKRYIWVL
jgi:outer membrane usher protein